MFRSRLSDITIPDVSLPRYVLEEAAKYGNRKAFIDSDTGESVTFTELIAQIRRVGSALRRRGVRPGDVILVFSPNSLAYPVIIYAANYIGAVITTCNPLYTVGELLSQLQDSQVKYIFTVPEYTEKVNEALHQYGAIKEKFVVGHHPGYTAFSELLADDGQQFVEVPLDPSTALCLLPYSSGTTGKSKGVMFTHRNVVTVLEQLSHPDVCAGTPGREVMIGFLPFYHGYALCCLLSGAVRLGHTVVVMRKFDFKGYLEAIQRHKATILYLVPPVAVLLAKSPMTAKYDVSSVKFVYSGAAPLGPEQVDDLRRALGGPVVMQGYGMTETTAVSHIPPLRGLKHGSVGVLMSNMECKIVDNTTGELLGPNQDGEICLRGPTITTGYLNRPEITAQTIDQEGWLHTGDIGHVDEDGHFYIVDRVKELIKYKGLQVPPAELEAILLTHPALADAAVIGVPDTEAGELPRAYVVLKPKVKVTGTEIADYVAARVAPYKKLRGGVEFIAEIPKSASGKILRRNLKLRASQLPKSKL